jgi:hypothetical protein
MTTQRVTFTQRGGDGAGFFYLLASGGATGSLNFDFTSGVLPGAITFTRASIGTYNSSGNLLTTASANAARFNYVGGVANLLIEPSATNLILQSNNFAVNWTSSGAAVTLTAAQFISPDGSNNGWSMASNPTNGYIYESPTYSNIPYTISIWGKLITNNSVLQLQISGVNAGAIVLAAVMARFSFTATAPGGAGNALIQVVGPAGSIGIYGAQLETGSIPTSYIPTTTASVTRAADSAVFTIPTGINQLVYTFDDNSTQLVTVSAGSYTIPVTLNRPNIKSIVGSA